MKTIKDLIDKQISKALEDTFMDATVYGVGFIRVQFIDNDLSVENISYKEAKQEFEKIAELEKLLVKM